MHGFRKNPRDRRQAEIQSSSSSPVHNCLKKSCQGKISIPSSVLLARFNDTGSAEDLGILMHAQQDSFAHEGYGPEKGHVTEPFAPDYTYTNPSKADNMALDTYNVLLAAKSKIKDSGGCEAVDWNTISAKVSAFNKAKTDNDKNKILTEIRTLVDKHRTAQKEKEVIP